MHGSAPRAPPPAPPEPGACASPHPSSRVLWSPSRAGSEPSPRPRPLSVRLLPPPGWGVCGRRLGLGRRRGRSRAGPGIPRVVPRRGLRKLPWLLTTPRTRAIFIVLIPTSTLPGLAPSSSSHPPLFHSPAPPPLSSILSLTLVFSFSSFSPQPRPTQPDLLHSHRPEPLPHALQLLPSY